MSGTSLPFGSKPVMAALEMRAIVKRFGATLALDRVDFSLAPGEIHALLGENGAGKSTLMNILRGLTAPTAGQILLRGQLISFSSPNEASRAGIGMVHQHFLLVPTFTVRENLALAARSDQQSWYLNTASLIHHAEQIALRLGWTIPMDIPIADLPVGTQQRVEILKALLSDAKILLFDEPTAVLAPNEIEDLFTVLRALRAEGRSLVFVTHKLGEVMALCDRVTVLRRGHLVGTVLIGETDPDDLAQRMVGEAQIPALMEHEKAISLKNGSPDAGKQSSPALAVSHLETKSAQDAVALKDITFTLQPGEILGFAGVDGNGQAELAQVLTGLRPWTAGTVTVNGTELKRLRPPDLEKYSIATIPPDRHREGLALSLPIADNLIFEASSLPEFRWGPFLKRRALREFGSRLAQDFDIRAADIGLPAGSLSGGNQQKIVIARALWRKPALLVAVSPTRGLDVAATAYVHGRIRERQQEGGAVVLISTELDEVIALSTRIAVLYEGKIIGIVPANTPRTELGLMMGGHSQPSEAAL